MKSDRHRVSPIAFAWEGQFPLVVAMAIFLALLPGASAAGWMGHAPLPEPVPWLNQPEDFFLGNGVAAGGGAGDGTWNFLAGPDYTCPNYLNHEEIRLVVDGTEQLLKMDIHRGRKTGIFYGTKTIGDLKVHLLDYALNGEPWIARLVTIENESATARHQVSVRALINPIESQGRSDWIASDGQDHPCGVGLKLDTSLKCARGWCCPNWTNRLAVICFDEPTATVARAQFGYILNTVAQPIAPGGFSQVTLYHCFHYDDGNESGCIALARHRDSLSDLDACITWWRTWFDNVAPEYSLTRIPDQRARDLVEGGLAILKMNEGRDGGIVANERGWDMSYVRDGYCGLRGLSTFGHFEESRRFIQWLDHQVTVHGLVPNAGPCGSDIYAHPNGNNGKTCAEANAGVEVTALYSRTSNT